jgi:NADPH:quinone reductase-like Zn-dependent oxidoreductase
VLILGGGAGSGAAAVQLLRLAYPSLPIFVTGSAKHHERLIVLGATKVFDYRSSSLASDIKAASPGGVGVDMIIDCVGSGASQTDIFTAFDPAGSRKYAALLTGKEFEVPEGVDKSDVNAGVLAELEGGKLVIPALTQLVEDGKYKVPLPVKIVGNGLGQVPEAMDLLKTVSGEKLIVAL